jgi:MFS transporter, DHA2 family, multidrug resistance protein
MTDGPRRKWIITLTVMTGTLMSTIDTSIVNVALPHMRGSFGASIEEITWVATGYMISNVVIMPIVAMLSSRFGRKRFYQFSVLLFTASSMLCGMAWNLTSMVIFRMIQGIGGGTLIPVAQAIMRETFPVEEQGTAMAIYGLGVILGPAFGPTLGGWITDRYTWPWVFYINVPVGIINMLLVMRFISDPPYLVRERGKIDVSGLLLLIIGLGALQLMLEKGGQKNWFDSSYIITLAFIAGAGLLLFIWRELSVERPAADLRILKNVTFASGTMIGGILAMGLYASVFLLPQFLQHLLGYPALDSGLALMPRSLAMLLTMPLAGRLYNRVGPRPLVISGLLISVFAFWRLSCLSLSLGVWDIFWPQFIQGTGNGLLFVAVATAALSEIDRRKMTAATGLHSVVRQVSGSIGIALAASQLTRTETISRAILMENVTSGSDKTAEWLRVFSDWMFKHGSDSVTAGERALKFMDHEIMKQAGMMAFNHVYFLLACLFALAIPFTFLLKRNGRNSTHAVKPGID